MTAYSEKSTIFVARKQFLMANQTNAQQIIEYMESLQNDEQRKILMGFFKTAVGWMLREMGKRVSMDLLRDFLRQHAHEMPRTMLRYAIEKMPEKERKEWMSQ